MANELVHASQGTTLTQAEFEAEGLHVCNSQATGDLIYASSASQLSRLAIGAADTVFTCNGTIPSWSATPILNTAVAKGTWTASGTWTIPAVTLGGAVAGGDQAFTNVGDMTFAAGSILASGSTNGNTLLIRANDTTFITLTTGATDACTIANATMSGTWLASGTVTLPAITLGGAIAGGSQVINTIGHIGMGQAAQTNIALFYRETFTNPDGARYGMYVSPYLLLTADNANSVTMMDAGLSISDGNAVVAYTGMIIGLMASLTIVAQTQAQTYANYRQIDLTTVIGANATLTNRYALFVRDATGAGTLTNQYGIYIDTMTKGATLNYAIYNVSAPIYTGGYMEYLEMTAPGAGAANTARVYAVVGGDTLTDLAAVFQDGSVEIFAQETTDPDSPIFQFPDMTDLKLQLRKPDRKTVQFAAIFPDGREFIMREIQYPVEKWN